MEETNFKEENRENEEEETAEAMLAQCENEKNEFIELAKRLKADFANSKKDQEREMAKVVQFANEDLILRLLPVIDSFDLAMKHIPSDIEENQWVSGIRSIKQQLDGTLKQIGVTEIITANTPFDMHSHEAVLEIESDGPEGEIAQELQKGYILRDKTLRPAKVSVTKKKES